MRVTPQIRHLTVRETLEGLRDGKLTVTDDGTVAPLLRGGAGPNTNPIFTLTPNVSGAAPSAACTKSDGTGTIGTDVFKAFTAGLNGSFITRVRCIPVATAAATATTATVGRVFMSSKTSGATVGGSDTFALGEVTLPLTTADSASAPVNPIEILLNMAIPATYTILVTNHAAPAANTSWQMLVIGGDY